MTKTSNIAATTKKIVKKHGGDKSALIAVLQDIQEAFNYLPKDALKAAGKSLGILTAAFTKLPLSTTPSV